jgi:hypothetical protein
MSNFFLVFICLFFILLPTCSIAHAPDLVGAPTSDVAFYYLYQGLLHIIPKGLDHILFVLCLFFLSPNLKTVLWQSLAFTVAHSITLGLVVCGFISPPSYIIEPIIALSIMFVAIENIITNKLKPSRIVLIVIFGLIHGMGFASVLNEIGLPEDKFMTSLITFNLGVELGQITVIVVAFVTLGYWFNKKLWYKERIVIPICILISIIAFYWVIERVFLRNL